MNERHRKPGTLRDWEGRWRSLTFQESKEQVGKKA